VVVAFVFGTRVAVVTYDVHAQVFSANAPVADTAAAFVRARLIVQAVIVAPAIVVAAVVARAWVAVVARDALAEVLFAPAVDTDVTRTAGGSIADWVVVTLITGRTATKKIEPNKDTFVFGAWVAVIAVPARTRGPAPHHRHDAQRKR
jgi:hypothetical protein